MNIIFTPTAWKQYTEWQEEDKKMVRKINMLIKDIERNGLLHGTGKPEPLKYNKLCVVVKLFCNTLTQFFQRGYAAAP